MSFHPFSPLAEACRQLDRRGSAGIPAPGSEIERTLEEAALPLFREAQIYTLLCALVSIVTTLVLRPMIDPIKATIQVLTPVICALVLMCLTWGVKFGRSWLYHLWAAWLARQYTRSSLSGILTGMVMVATAYMFPNDHPMYELMRMLVMLAIGCCMAHACGFFGAIATILCASSLLIAALGPDEAMLMVGFSVGFGGLFAVWTVGRHCVPRIREASKA